MTQIIIDIFISMLSACIFWLLTFVITGTKVIFSNTIEKSLIEKAEDGSPLYRIRLMNIGNRDLVEVEYTAKLRIREGGRIRTTYLCLGDEQTIPVLKGKDKKKTNLYSTYLPGFYIKDVARNEFSKSIYSETIQRKAKSGVLVLDDLLKEYGNNLFITVFAIGSDHITGARKMFVSNSYTVENIIEGRFVKWNGFPRGIKKYFKKVKMALEIISEIDTVEDILRRTYVDTVETLNNTNPNAKDIFLKNEDLIKPQNEYKTINIDEINKRIKMLREFLDGMNSLENLSKQMQAGIMLLNRNLLSLNFIKANYDYLYCEENLKEEKALIHMDLNSKLYGLPKKEVFDSILQEINENREKQSSRVFHPKKEIVREFSCKVLQYMESMMSYIPNNQETFSVHEACCIANEILIKEMKATEFGWRAIVEENATYASVSQRERIVRFPGNRSKGDYTYHDLRAIIAHEIGVHVKRALIANKIGSFALSIGLPGYESFEEGMAVAFEQAVNQEYSHPGYRHYLNISFSIFEKMNFRDVFNKALEIWGDTEKNRKVVFDSVQRTFRGTGELVNSKDLVYYNGADIFWRYVENNIEDENMINNLFKFGKIDNSCGEHVAIAQGIFQELE